MLVFQKMKIQKLNFFENFGFFLRFQKIRKKTVIYVLDLYIAHVHTKFQVDIFLSLHFMALERF